jgi:hypothetical protein
MYMRMRDVMCCTSGRMHVDNLYSTVGGPQRDAVVHCAGAHQRLPLPH